MSSFKVVIQTADGVSFEDTATKLVVRTTTGDVGILKNHVNYVAALGTGALRFIDGKNERIAASSGGFVEVSSDGVTILARTFEWSEDIDLQRAEKAKDNAKLKLQGKLSNSEQKVAEIALKRAVNRINIASK